MRVSEKNILATLSLALLALATIGATSVLRVGATPSPSWQVELGFYLPFALFGLVTTYHFLEWARKHRRQAIIMIMLILTLASFLGVGIANAPRPGPHPVQLSATSTTQEIQRPGTRIPSPQQSLQENLIKLREVLSDTPYFSATFDAIALGATVLAIAVVLLKTRGERRSVSSSPVFQSLRADMQSEDPRHHIIECYRLATLSVQAGGMLIPDSDTPSDAFQKIRHFKPNIADAFWKLTVLFEEAKFSLHQMTGEQAGYATQYYKLITDYFPREV